MKTLLKIGIKVLIVWIAISVITIKGKPNKDHLGLAIGASKEIVAEGTKTAKEIGNHVLDIPMEPIIHEDPYDKLYNEDSDDTRTLREVIADSKNEIKNAKN